MGLEIVNLNVQTCTDENGAIEDLGIDNLVKIQRTAKVAKAQAEKEISVFAERVQRMFGMTKELIHSKENSEEFTKLFSRLEKYEDMNKTNKYTKEELLIFSFLLNFGSTQLLYR